jgi:hypothetical protein
LVGQAEANVRDELLERHRDTMPQRPFRRCVLALVLGIDAREASSKGICRFTMKIATGILGGVTDQNILRETIFVWMHFFLA